MTDEVPQGINATGASSVSNVMMMPWFLGGPWVPKFGDREKSISFPDWHMQIETFIRAQNLTQTQQVDFVLSTLQGDARREVLLLPADDRNTPDKIFKALTDLYGEQATVVQLRAKFFTCRQQVGEEVGGFVLRLRECLARWREKEPRAEGERNDDDEMLRSQLVAGLRSGPIQQELHKLLRRQPTLTFAEVSKEAKAVEREQDHDIEEATSRRTYVPTKAPNAGRPVDNWQEIKQTLKAEVLAEVKEEMLTLKDSILGEIRQQFRENRPSTRQSDQRGVSRWGNDQRPRRRRERNPKWDEQGRPICLHCDQPGHMQRDCPERQPPSQDF